jgi:ergothioneine biosynthesis protein EgtB
MILVENVILQRYLDVRKQSIKLVEPLEAEDFVVQPVTDVSPPKWHLAHTTWFFEEFILVPNLKGYKVYDSDFSFMFNSYYETVGERVFRADRGNMTRPVTKQIMEYREYVDNAMIKYLTQQDVGLDQPLNLIELGINHEQQHQELLVTDIKYILGHNPLFPVYKEIDLPIGSAPNNENYIEIGEGIYEIGYNGKEFHFDNEEGVHKVYLHSFKILDRLITNGEYLEFMKAGGYEDFRYWLSEGWEFAKGLKVKAPMYWHKVKDQWNRYTLGGLKLVDPAAPVTHICYYEADAFARWKGKRLPTEFEWEVASKLVLPGNEDQGNFVETGFLEPVSRTNESNQMLGDVWEWTQSAYLPYPGFKIAHGAVGEYNGKFMINQMVLRGGSCATPKSHIRSTYRNFWHPHLRWQFNGLRLAEHL